MQAHETPPLMQAHETPPLMQAHETPPLMQAHETPPLIIKITLLISPHLITICLVLKLPPPHRGSRKDDSSRSLNGSVEDSISELPASEHPLYKQLKELNEEKDTLQMMYEQAIKGAEQYQKQLHRADEERRHALATSEALAALWQKKFENAQNENRALQNENMEIRQDLRSYDNRVSHLQELLAQFRLQSRGLPGMNGDGVNNERLSPLQGSQHDTYDILSPEEGDEASWI